MALRTLSRPRCWKGIGYFLGSTHPRKQFGPGDPFVLRSFAGLRTSHLAKPTMDQDHENHPSDLGNSGLEIKRAFKHLGHRHWGFTVYRCTYGDEGAWSRFMATLHDSVRAGLAYSATEELMDSLDCSVRQDASTLDGASKDLVRQRLRAWASGSEADAERETADSQPIQVGGAGSTPRYNYCIQVDEDALRSVVGSTNGASDTEGYVNLIKADWALPGPEEAEERRREFDIDDPFDEGEEAIEGCKMHDVGWMKVSVAALMPDAYAALQAGAWDENYVRPPDLAEF